ncbi:MAG: hypothetical protein IT449_08755 [Phycisphaerales bacterium]|nr:hypothetical protein [Phycisphaerales bacterium]
MTPSSQMTTPQKVALGILLGSSALVRAALVLHAGPMTGQGLYVDDAFMSHKIAMNIAEGRGITQAGAATNGFQPLFVFLLVPLYWILDAGDATVASALMCSTFGVLCAVWIYKILSRLHGARVGLIGAALFVASSFMARAALCGLETSLANLMMLIVLERDLQARLGGRLVTLGRAAVFGLLLGLAVLARIDLVFIVIPILLAWAQRCRSRTELGRCAVSIGMCVAVLAPWFMWSWIVCGSMLPSSGEATRTISQLYGTEGIPVASPVYFEPGAPPVSFYALHATDALTHLVAETPLSQPVYTFLRAAPQWSGLWIAGWCAAAWLAHRRLALGHPDARRLRNLWRAMPSAWVFAVLLIAAYSTWGFGRWWFWRYMTPVGVLLVFPSALWVDAVINGLAAKSRGLGAVACLFMVAIYGAAGIDGHVRLFGDPPPSVNEPRMYADTLALRELLPRGCRIGSFESGILDYYLGWDVINLDGKTHAAALDALKTGRMDRFIEEEGLEYIVSSPPLLRDLLSRRGNWKEGRLGIIAKLSHNWVLKVERDETGKR